MHHGQIWAMCPSVYRRKSECDAEDQEVSGWDNCRRRNNHDCGRDVEGATYFHLYCVYWSISFLGLVTQMLISSRNTPTDTPRINILPTLWASSSPVKLIHIISHHVRISVTMVSLHMFRLEFISAIFCWFNVEMKDIFHLIYSYLIYSYLIHSYLFHFPIFCCYYVEMQLIFVHGPCIPQLC